MPQGTLSAYQAAEQWKEFFFIEEGEASTGISNTVVQPTSGTPTYHTLDGREVKNPGKGIYIVNGKKVVIKQTNCLRFTNAVSFAHETAFKKRKRNLAITDKIPLLVIFDKTVLILHPQVRSLR